MTLALQHDVLSPWDQREGETFQQYQAFRTYLEMPREDRSLTGSWKLAQSRGGAAIKGMSDWKEAGLRQQWEDRAKSWDRWLDNKALEKLANRRIEALTEMADLGRALRTKASKALLALKAFETATDKDGNAILDKDGNETIYTRLNAAEIAKLAQVGVEMEQLAIGAPTSRQSLIPSAEDSTLAGIAASKTELRARVLAIAERRRIASTSIEPEPPAAGDASTQLEAIGLLDEIDAEGNIISHTADPMSPFADFEVVIEGTEPSPEDIRRSRFDREPKEDDALMLDAKWRKINSDR